jgi:hypothetical protein
MRFYFYALLLMFYSDYLIEKFMNSTEEDTRKLDELVA